MLTKHLRLPPAFQGVEELWSRANALIDDSENNAEESLSDDLHAEGLRHFEAAHTEFRRVFQALSGTEKAELVKEASLYALLQDELTSELLVREALHALVLRLAEEKEEDDAWERGQVLSYVLNLGGDRVTQEEARRLFERSSLGHRRAREPGKVDILLFAELLMIFGLKNASREIRNLISFTVGDNLQNGPPILARRFKFENMPAGGFSDQLHAYAASRLYPKAFEETVKCSGVDPRVVDALLPTWAGSVRDLIESASTLSADLG